MSYKTVGMKSLPFVLKRCRARAHSPRDGARNRNRAFREPINAFHRIVSLFNGAWLENRRFLDDEHGRRLRLSMNGLLRYGEAFSLSSPAFIPLSKQAGSLFHVTSPQNDRIAFICCSPSYS